MTGKLSGDFGRNDRKYKPADTQATPWAFFKQLDHEFHFTLDACADADNAKCERFYSVEENGLLQAWAPDVVWCNPPYSEIPAWLSKARFEVEHGAIVVMLLPVRTSNAWWHEHVWGKADLRFVRGRLAFNGQATTAPHDSVVVIFRRTSPRTPSP